MSLADLYTGKTVKINMKRDILCAGCEGKGGTLVKECETCNGKGIRILMQQVGPMMAMRQEPCIDCNQTGECILVSCDDCKGKRVIEREVTLDVVVEPGMQEGDRITLPAQCSESPMFETPGDVILIIRSADEDMNGPSRWMRKGSDLMYEVHLRLEESLLGWERQLQAHPSGKDLHIVWTGGVLRDGEILRVAGWGMPDRSSGGACGAPATPSSARWR